MTLEIPSLVTRRIISTRTNGVLDADQGQI